jgi:hypothetical protein
MSGNDSLGKGQDLVFRAIGATLEALIVAFRRLDKSLSCSRKKG